MNNRVVKLIQAARNADLQGRHADADTYDRRLAADIMHFEELGENIGNAVGNWWDQGAQGFGADSERRAPESILQRITDKLEEVYDRFENGFELSTANGAKQRCEPIFKQMFQALNQYNPATEQAAINKGIQYQMKQQGEYKPDPMTPVSSYRSQRVVLATDDMAAASDIRDFLGVAQPLQNQVMFPNGWHLYIQLLSGVNAIKQILGDTSPLRLDDDDMKTRITNYEQSQASAQGASAGDNPIITRYLAQNPSNLNNEQDLINFYKTYMSNNGLNKNQMLQHLQDKGVNQDVINAVAPQLT